MSVDQGDASFDLDAVFLEQPRPPSPEPSFSTYVRILPDNQTADINIRLVGSHPLWAHHLWNASRAFASYLQTTHVCSNRTVLELGAGGALPSIIAALTGASKVVVTDYPDMPLLDNIRYNMEVNLSKELQGRVSVLGYIWGQDTTPLFSALPTDKMEFDIIIMSDLIFNHSQHDALLATCERTVSSKGGLVLVFYTHHRPHLAHRDLQFFEKARSRGWNAEEIVTETFPPMFPDDPGDEQVRSTVHGWKLTRPLFDEL